jgi:hypothetical protein
MTTANGVEAVSERYSMSLSGIPLWIRKGIVSEWVLKYRSGSRDGVRCARCGAPGSSEGRVLRMESPDFSKADSTGRVGGGRHACSAASASCIIRYCHMRVMR